jgi:hypothetical protein
MAPGKSSQIGKPLRKLVRPCEIATELIEVAMPQQFKSPKTFFDMQNQDL